MIIEELWSKRDEAHAARCIDALAADDLAGALMAVEGASAEHTAEARAQLRDWARTLASRLDRSRDAAARSHDEAPRALALALASYLGDELDFRGDTERYYDRENSELSR